MAQLGLNTGIIQYKLRLASKAQGTSNLP